MHSTLTWRSERVDDEDGGITYEAHGPRDSFVVFEGPNAKADCDAFMRAIGEWQPIETAPKDGTEFLACWPLQQNVMQIVRWCKIHGYWKTKGRSCGTAGAVWMLLPAAPHARSRES